MRNSSASTLRAYRWMLGFSEGENVRDVLRLKETAGAACRTAGSHSASRRNPTAHTAVLTLSLRRAEYSTGTLPGNSNSPATAAISRQDDVQDLRSKRASFHPLYVRRVRCDTPPSPPSLQ